jgi:exopolysaccharide biosynthesis polyprenyl glycosylphosphotransferase
MASYATNAEISPNRSTVVPFPARSYSPHAIPREEAYRLCALLFFGDWIVASVAVFSGLQLRNWQRVGSIVGPASSMDARSSLMLWCLGGGTLFAWLMVAFKTYEVVNLYRMQRLSKNLLRSVLIWAIVVWAYIGLFQVTGFTPRIGVAYCIVTLTLFVTLWRLGSFVFLIQPSVKEAASSRVIVVGWNDKVANLRKAMRRDLAQLDEIIGCVPMPGGLFASKPPAELAVLGDYSDLPKIVSQCQVNSIILSDVSCSAREIEHLILFCQREMLGFQMVPEYFPALNSGLQVQTLSGVPLLGVSQLPLDRTLNRLIKRMMDIVGASIGMLISAVVIPPFALFVYLESPGPLLHRQLRTSRGGRTFFIYKLRTTRLSAGPGQGLSTDQEPPSTRFGAFMRRHDFDELPQFWNVLNGDMSIVGPCPEQPEVIERFKAEIPSLNVRHEVRAGITGWSQIHGLHGDTDLSQRVKADLYYLENWSIMIDLFCIVASPFRARSAR